MKKVGIVILVLFLATIIIGIIAISHMNKEKASITSEEFKSIM